MSWPGSHPLAPPNRPLPSDHPVRPRSPGLRITGLPPPRLQHSPPRPHNQAAWSTCPPTTAPFRCTRRSSRHGPSSPPYSPCPRPICALPGIEPTQNTPRLHSHHPMTRPMQWTSNNGLLPIATTHIVHFPNPPPRASSHRTHPASPLIHPVRSFQRSRTVQQHDRTDTPQIRGDQHPPDARKTGQNIANGILTCRARTLPTIARDPSILLQREPGRGSLRDATV